MSKLAITGIENYGKVHRYIIKKEKNMHTILCNLLSKLGLSKNSILKVDTDFDHLYDDYIYVGGKNHEVHFFVTQKYVNLVIKTSWTQKRLNEFLKEFFNFSK